MKTLFTDKRLQNQFNSVSIFWMKERFIRLLKNNNKASIDNTSDAGVKAKKLLPQKHGQSNQIKRKYDIEPSNISIPYTKERHQSHSDS